MHLYSDSVQERTTYSAVESVSGDLYFAAICHELSAADLVLARVAANGDTIATRSYSFSGYTVYGGLSSSLISLQSGEFLLVASQVPVLSGPEQGLMVWFDQDLDTIRTVVLSDADGLDLNAAYENPDGSLTAIGWTNTTTPDFYWALLDSTGNLIDERDYSESYDDECYSGEAAMDGGRVLCGARDLASWNRDVLLRKVAPDGSTEWVQNFGSPDSDNSGFVRALPDTTYLIGCGIRPGPGFPSRATLIKVGANGDELWRTWRPGVGQSSFLTKPLALPGRIVVAGSVNLAGGKRGLLVAFDPTGDLIWQRTFAVDTLHAQSIYDLRSTADGGFVMAGYAWDEVMGHDSPWLIKVDSFGCVTPGCELFDAVEEQHPVGSLSFFPNPVGEYTRLSCPVGGVGATVVIIDATGREVVRTIVPVDGELRVAHLGNGVYDVLLLDAHGLRKCAGRFAKE